MKKSNYIVVVCSSVLFALFSACASRPEPVDIYPEDMCAYCRMAISDRTFAAEVITDEGGVFKFDDIICLASYREQPDARKGVAIFLVDYHTKEWILHEKAYIVQTNIQTPMGSGLVAFADSTSSVKFQRLHSAGAEVGAK